MSDVVVAEYLDGGPGESDPEHDGGVVLLVAQHQGPLGEQPREVQGVGGEPHPHRDGVL